MAYNTSDMAEQVEALLRQMQRAAPATPEDLLSDLMTTVLEGMPTARHVGITVATRRGDVATLASSGPMAELLDRLQAQHQEGPCLSAAWADHVVHVPDLNTERRWPAYAAEALEQTDIRSILAFQLFADQQTMGALNFYAEQPDAFGVADVETGLALATHTVLAWSLIRRDDQFRSALASRDLIGQAKGIIMERFSIGAVQAFELLRRLSQQSNSPLIEVAQRIADQSGDAKAAPPSKATHR